MTKYPWMFRIEELEAKLEQTRHELAITELNEKGALREVERLRAELRQMQAFEAFQELRRKDDIIAQLRAERDAAYRKNADLIRTNERLFGVEEDLKFQEGQISVLQRKLVEVGAERDAARAALEFYGNERNHWLRDGRSSSIIGLDMGKRASAALNQGKTDERD